MICNCRHFYQDDTVFIRNSINEVKSTIVEAFVLVVLISIFIFT